MADAPLDTLDGTVTGIVFRNDETGYSVLRVAGGGDGSFSLKGSESVVVGTCGAVWEGEDLHAVGEWVTDKVHGRQFKAKEITCATPRSVAGIERYLASGLIKGIGPEYAKRIVARFGEETVEILDHHSGRLREVPGIGETRLVRIKKSWEAERGTREVMIFTQGYGISVAKTVLTTVLNLFLTSMMAYALSRREYVLRKFITTVLVMNLRNTYSRRVSV